MESETTWKPITPTEPAIDEVVLTCIDDGKGHRNEQRLKRYRRNDQCADLWFFEDGSMYVYYVPTHYIPAASAS